MLAPCRRRPWPSLALAVCALLSAGCSGGRDRWLADLQSTRAEERALALRKLAERPSPDDVPLFSQAARDPVAIVRAEAVAALARSGDARVVDLLGEALGDTDALVVKNAAFGLASLKTEKATAYLSLQYGRRTRNTRLIIVQALQSTNLPGAMATVVAAEANRTWERATQALRDGAPAEKVGAVETLGRSGRLEAIDRLVPLLKDKQLILAAAAARGLGLARDARAVPALLAALQENFPELREAACEALGELKDPQAGPALTAVALEASPASPLAAAALAALPRTPELDKALCTVALASAGRESAIAAREMSRRDGCPVELLTEKLRGSPQAQAAALTAVALLGPKASEAVPRIVPLLSSGDPQLRALAYEALGAVQDGTVSAALSKAWDAELKALEPLRADWVPGPLPRQLAPGFDPQLPFDKGDPELEVMAKGSALLRKVRALDARRAEEAGKRLKEQLPPGELVDDVSEAQLQPLAALIRAMGRLRVPGLAARLEGWTGDGSPLVRAAALGALAREEGELQLRAARGLFDAEPRVQEAVAEGLSHSSAGRAQVLEAARLLTGDAARLLESLRGQELPQGSAALLLEVVKGGGAQVGTAALLLAEAKATEAVPALVKYLEDPTAPGRAGVLLALGRLGQAQAAEAVGRELYSESPELRAAAAEALGLLKDSTQLAPLGALRGDYHLKVREAAQAALTSLGQETAP